MPLLDYTSDVVVRSNGSIVVATVADGGLAGLHDRRRGLFRCQRHATATFRARRAIGNGLLSVACHLLAASDSAAGTTGFAERRPTSPRMSAHVMTVSSGAEGVSERAARTASRLIRNVLGRRVASTPDQEPAGVPVRAPAVRSPSGPLRGLADHRFLTEETATAHPQE
jgi:hypothetical protein